MIVLPAPIRIEDWPALARQHNLPVKQRIIVGDDLTLTLVLNTDFLCVDERNMTMPEAVNKLCLILTNMHNLALKSPGKVFRHELPGGLRIDIFIGIKDGFTRLQLSRMHTWPSATEFTVTLNSLPFDLPLDLQPERQVYQDRYYLRCKWPTHPASAPSPTPPAPQTASHVPDLAGKQ